VVITKELVSPNPEVYPDGFDEPDYKYTELTPSMPVPSAYSSAALQVQEIQTASSITAGQAEKVLVIPIEFTDETFYVADGESSEESHDQAYYEGIMGEMKAYYEFNSNYVPDVSGITLDVTVVEVVQSVHDMAYYGADGVGVDTPVSDRYIYELTREALLILNTAGFDFTQYDTDEDGIIDHIMIIHAGNGQEEDEDTDTIWSHRWAITGEQELNGVNAYNYTMLAETSALGTFAHEFGHDLGLPDLYDTNGFRDGYSEGAGEWDIMGSGSWNGIPRGSNPANLSAWSRIEMGWATTALNTVTVLDNDTLDVQVTNLTGLSHIYRINPKDDENVEEYYLLEYRRSMGYDEDLPGEGVLIWHIDESVLTGAYSEYAVNDNSSRLGVYPEQADGEDDLVYNVDLPADFNRGDDGDPFPGSTDNHNFTYLPYRLNSSNIDPDNYTYVDILDIQIIDTDGDSFDDAATFDVYLEVRAPGQAAFIAPVDNRYVAAEPVFTWQIVPQTETYIMQISGDLNFGTSTQYFITTSLTVDADGICRYVGPELTPDMMNYVRLAATNSSSIDGNYLWSDTLEITVVGIDPPSNFSIANIEPNSIDLEWTEVVDAPHYYLEIDGVETELDAVTSYAHTGLVNETAHEYRIRATTATESSVWSDTLSAETAYTLSIDGSAVIEGEEDGKIITVTANSPFSGDATDGTSVTLTELPSGVTQDSVEFGDDNRTLIITLAGNSDADYDVDATITLVISSTVIVATLSETYITKDFEMTATIEPEP
ncbi:MAG: M6 family metalloprotease domain-containing protein, partial [Vallitaleaceae bacterium]|nr:M6 family metalloprotease domain-containing protein [Vallitaleaceae bacterium]